MDGNSTSRQDHPRSRGVYLKQIARDVEKGGSSPLARGLQAPPGVLEFGRRIIPARAGFTKRTKAANKSKTDHPRSRGVYPHGFPWGRWPHGSSPLARGLLKQEFYDKPTSGIIPARAGFTPPCAHACQNRWDHPRSRGVYRRTSLRCLTSLGSSPLARGLHLRIPGIPTMSHATRPRLPSVPT